MCFGSEGFSFLIALPRQKFVRARNVYEPAKSGRVCGPAFLCRFGSDRKMNGAHLSRFETGLIFVCANVFRRASNSGPGRKMKEQKE